MKLKTHTSVLFALCLLFFCRSALAQPVASRLLRSVEVTKVGDDYVAHISFSTGMQYLSHIPPDRGKTLKITLTTPVRLQRERVDPLDQERIAPSGVKSPLDDVVLDLSNPARPLLVLQFDSNVTFEVRGGSDFRSVNISFRPVSAKPAAEKPVEPKPEKQAQVPPAAPRVPAKDLEKTKVGRLYLGAREAFVTGDYNRAIQLATSAVEKGTPAEFRDALELLGMAREAKGQLAHATAEYERYIELYAKTEDVSRVQQRLDAILTAALPAAPVKPKDERVVVAKTEAPGWRYRRSGGASVYYYNDSLKVDDRPTDTTRSSLVADVNFNTRSSRDAHLLETRLTASYEYDLQKEDRDNITRVNEAYVAWSNHRYDFKTLLGRESRSTDGIQGRYDGLLLSKKIAKKVALNVIAGYPVESTKDSIDTDRPFYGVSLDLGNFGSRWDFNAYLINREFEGLTDRRAAGGEFRYFNNGMSVFGLVDYDIEFKEFNSAILLGNWVRNNSTVFFNVDYRKSPSLATKNALFGQIDTSIADLLRRFTADEIERLALQHVADSMFTTIGYSHTLNPKHQVSVDVTASKLGDIEGSEFFPASPGTSTEFFYNLQWITNSIFKQNDNYIFGIKYEDLDRLERYTFQINARVPVGKKWRLNPKLSWATSDSKNSANTQDKLKASFNAIYRFNRDTEFEAEIGTERISDDGPNFSGSTDINYIFGGLRKYF